MSTQSIKLHAKYRYSAKRHQNPNQENEIVGGSIPDDRTDHRYCETDIFQRRLAEHVWISTSSLMAYIQV